MGDGVIYFDKRHKNELDPYPSYSIHIQKMRLTRVNEIPQPFVFTGHGIELIGTVGFERKIASHYIAAHRGKTEFIATIDHELRISLNSIIGFSELMKEKAPGELNEKQERYVYNVLKSGKHLLDLIQ